MRFGRSRSFKVIHFCTVRNPIYDFLLVIDCNLGCIFHRFWVIAPRRIKPQIEMTQKPWNFAVNTILAKAMCYFQMRNCVILASAMQLQRSAKNKHSAWQCCRQRGAHLFVLPVYQQRSENCRTRPAERWCRRLRVRPGRRCWTVDADRS